jgi:hypothetical protein
MRRAIVLVPLVLAGCLVSQHECTEVGCVDGLWIDLRSSSGAWQPGTYHVGITADGESITCSATIPLPKETGGPNTTCSSRAVWLGLSGSALPASAQSISDLVFTSFPASVSIVITRDAKPFASTTITPTYTTSRPNGPECEPTCRGAHATMDVP